jgi:hypothetical protein
MYAGLIVVRGAQQQIVALFEKDDLAITPSQCQRGHAAEKSAADDHGISIAAHAIPPHLSIDCAALYSDRGFFPQEQSSRSRAAHLIWPSA